MAAKAASFHEKQQDALNKFRDSLKDVLQPCHDDFYLMRWIMANHTSDFDLKKSEADLRTHLEWRQQIGADTVLEWTPPEVLRRFYPGGLYGHDKMGRPIWIEPLGCSDVKGLLQSAKKSDIIRLKIQHIELIHRDINAQRAKVGESVDGLITLFDLEHLGMQHLWKPAIDVYTEVLTIFERHYPETLRKTYVLNAPKIFPIAYSVVKPFLSEATKSKIVILGRNWRSVLLEHIDADQLPVHWGGTATDPDGDPCCRSQITMGGRVDWKYYLSAHDVVDRSSYKKVVVGRRSNVKLEFHVAVPDSTLRWSFMTDGLDIGFAVSFRQPTAAGNAEKSADRTILPLYRLNSHMVPEDGSISCADPGTYVVTFDNSYSWMHSKKLYYHIDVIEPSQDLMLAEG